MQVQETYVKVATRLFNRRRTNVTPCLLIETKALCEILNLWGGRVEKHVPVFSFPHPFPSLLNCRRLSPLGLWQPHLGSVYLTVDFAVPGTSFPICYHFVTHMLTLLPSPSFPWENTMNKDLLVLKKKERKKERRRAEGKEHTSKCRENAQNLSKKEGQILAMYTPAITVASFQWSGQLERVMMKCR